MTSNLLVVTPEWRAAHPGAQYGLLAVRGVVNPAAHDAINAEASALEAEVRERYGSLERDALRATPPLPAYADYYKRWGQRYHVGMQLESVAQKGKDLPRVAALVEAMFICELRNLLLTAGHDLDALVLPLRLRAGAWETFISPGGKEMAVKEGDMFTADSEGRVLSAIITGPSDVARIGPDTMNAVFYSYVPPGIPTAVLEAHLDEIERNVRLISPDAEVIARELVSAD